MNHEIKTKLNFPHGFFWGAATASHQIEGGNTKNDWWAWEHSLKRTEDLKKEGKNPENFYSGQACDSYHRFAEDFELAKQLNHNAHRLSLEWSRIEPKEGEFNEKELDHYEKVLQTAKSHGLTTFVTLHHYTNPVWFAQKQGFTKKKNLDYFVRYVKTVTSRLSEYADFFMTFNEPEVYSNLSFMRGRYPPQQKNPFITFIVIQNLITAHNICAEYIRTHIKKPVSIAFHLSDLQPSGWLGHLGSGLAHYVANEYMLKRTIKHCDFIGVNYYFHHHVGFFGKRHTSLTHHDVTDLGWGIHPEGLERVLLNLKKYQKPIYITENGIADARDQKRERFIKDHLFYIHKAIQKGADVRGYLYWSLLDNFEWDQGFGPRFGLIEIDYDDLLRRKVRRSAWAYAEVCKNNCLEI